MSHPQSRRKFVRLVAHSTIALVAAGLVQCKPSKKKNGNPEARKKITKKKWEPPVTMKMVQNRGWYIHNKNQKIHYFDDRGYTPSLYYLKNKNEFDAFVKNLKPYDAHQLTQQVFNKQVSKKKKDWITEHTAVAMVASQKFGDAFAIIEERIRKSSRNYRLWDLAAIIAFRSATEIIRSRFISLSLEKNSASDKILKRRIEKYNDPAWQAKIIEKNIKWSGQSI